MTKLFAAIMTALLLLTISACAAVPSSSLSTNSIEPTTVLTTKETTGTSSATSTNSQSTATTTAMPIPMPASGTYQLVDAYPQLSFNQPLYFAVSGDDSRDCYVVERSGLIRIFEDRSDVEEIRTFLDISKRIDSSKQEKGLLGLAFHPDYQRNGFLYVNYTNQEHSVISRFTRRENNRLEADPASELVLMTIKQPYANHNGGQLAFGPDGCLYIATGDGGSSGDPQNNAQNQASLLGKILRIDVDQPENDKPYGIPDDNPYAGNTRGYAEEIFALGLRNPWRFSFDQAGNLWVADVGQNKLEEINLVENGRNYGWNAREGSLPYKEIPGVNLAEMVAPVWEYDRDQGKSVTGGYVYNGDLAPSLKGTYIYGDFISGRLWALWDFSERQVKNQLLLETGLSISSFGIDAFGELRIVDYAGKLYRLSEVN